MTAFVLGIDSAWKRENPSGVAFIELVGKGTARLIRLARSYQEFVSGGISQYEDWLASLPTGNAPLKQVLHQAERSVGTRPKVVSLDIPLAPESIVGRRCADTAISREYGGRKAAAHSPTSNRPGKVSVEIFQALKGAGYTWAHEGHNEGTPDDHDWFFETYPHPAVIELMGLQERLPYKVGKRARYWRGEKPEVRWLKLVRNMDRLREYLGGEIDGLGRVMISAQELLDRRSSPFVERMKGLEDALDAAVCALVAARFLEGRVHPFGDSKSAIWIPTE